MKWRSLAALLLFASSCASSGSLYAWGSYEESVLALCTDFSDTELHAEIALLDAHVSSLTLEDRVPAPGVHAQLGYLEYLAGNGDAAKRHFEAEKTIYPEARVFMDRLLSRMANP